VKFRFDIDKAIAAAAYLIQKAGGRYDVFVLLKTIAWAERNAIISHGRTITGDKLVSMDKGPVLSCIYDLIKGKELIAYPDALTKWKKHISERQAHLLRLKDNPEIGYLSVREMKILDDAFHTISKIPAFWLAEWTHQNFPEWEDPKGSSREIDPVKILKTAKKSDNEIAEIEDEVSEINALKAFLAA